MTAGLSPLFADLVRQTIRNPQGAARRLIALDPPMEARWIGLFLVTILALLITRVAILTMPTGTEPQFFAMLAHPWLGIPLQAGSMVVMAAGIAGGGRIFGGTGRFADALLLVVWLQVMLTLLQAVQFFALLILPPLGALIAFAAIGVFLWFLVHFTAALHDFTNLPLVFFGLLVGFVTLVVALAVLLMLLGVSPPVEAV
ncbi:hypothetical protein DEA8626_01465 [Defluviimonas aquaemixtae]|uniref:Yip1 domain-containing protein n=1 Tax=Albidovulum aquaemixtae TaxID=1542388 RepID=A0A2R8B5T0_9RHOB|nr:YIP1 family protein [Defluviimonas aquaemixtae]SPH17936.1 hypothetical protein DEA8626_01465 [Defluviimonas aquaemixtae]